MHQAKLGGERRTRRIVRLGAVAALAGASGRLRGGVRDANTLHP
jgi:hypothetical protein